jgi:hypothetical protein
VDRLAHATKPPEIFRILLEVSRLGAPRNAIFLWRQGVLRGWACRGYPREAAERLRHLTVTPGETWLGEVLETSEPCALGPGQEGPQFGQPPAVETWALPIRIGPRTLAVVLAERSEGDPALDISALKLITAVARLRLEVDLAWRKLRAATGTATEPATAPPALADVQPVRPPQAAPEPPISQPPQPAPEVQVEADTGLVAVADPAEPAQLERSRRDEARTFARLVATDIRLYNEEAVMLGRRHRDLARRLHDHLHQGRESFRRRFPDLGDEGLTLLHEAFVQVLAGGDQSLLPGSV